MKKALILFFIVYASLLFATHSLAALDKWEIDKAHSNVYFDIRHTYATIRGQFEDFSGTVQFDPDHLMVSSVEFEVKAKSVNTGIPNRDNHLRSDEFFAAKKFPSLTFRSTAVKQTESNQYTLVGILTIKGVSMKISAPLTYYGTKENPLKKGQQVAGFEARFSIDRLDFKVGTGKYAELGVIGKKVDVLVSLEVLHNN